MVRQPREAEISLLKGKGSDMRRLQKKGRKNDAIHDGEGIKVKVPQGSKK